MKLLILFSFLSTFAFAVESFKVTDIYCSDFDQWYVGEVCVVTLENHDKEVTLIVDLFEYLDLRLDLSNKFVDANLVGLKKCAPEAYEEIRLDPSKLCLNVRYGSMSETITVK